MSIAWFLVPYKRRIPDPRPRRYCAMNDYNAQINADGGAWSETEVLGDQAIVKVRASDVTLAMLAGVFRRFPLRLLDESLSTLTAAQRAAILDRLTAAGYTMDEIRATIGADIRNATLRQVLRFLASRRLKPRYDRPTDTIFVDGPPQTCRTVESVDQDIADV